MDAGRLERAGSCDEEYRSLTRAAFSWDVLWWCRHVTAHRALAWGRAGTCIYVYIHRYLPSRTRAQPDRQQSNEVLLSPLYC
jgi:hypothetical protein